jgi:Putative MetA-pathway of phenol degradation
MGREKTLRNRGYIGYKASCRKIAIAFASLLCALGVACGQDMAPRAYLITPLHSNAVTLTYSYFNGGFQFDGALPVAGATAKLSVPNITYYHALNFFGRSANLTVALPYGVGNLQGHVLGAEGHLYRSGLLDSIYRFSVNLKGGPAMPLEEMRKWRQKMLIGVSLKVVAPTGQYDPTKLINLGYNRWAFKPEVGYSQRWGHWVVDTYGAVWFYTTNPEFFSRNQYFPGTQTQSEKPVAIFEGHLMYDFKPRLWVSLDGNFWYGGETSLNGVPNPKTVQQNSRIGATASIPITKHQSLKFSYNNGAYVNYGGNYQNVSVAWQYSWIGWRK